MRIYRETILNNFEQHRKNQVFFSEYKHKQQNQYDFFFTLFMIFVRLIPKEVLI